MSASSLAFHWLSITSASVLMTPVAPTTSAQAMVMAPSRLCQSNQAMRRDLSRSVPKLRRRVNGQYSTTPETIAIRNRNPIAPRNSLPGWPANMSTWSFRNISIGPPPTGPSGLAVLASYARSVVASGSPSTLLLVKAITVFGSSLSHKIYCRTRPGSFASAVRAISSMLRFTAPGCAISGFGS